MREDETPGEPPVLLWERSHPWLLTRRRPLTRSAMWQARNPALPEIFIEFL
jgi:hypothetical protein